MLSSPHQSMSGSPKLHTRPFHINSFRSQASGFVSLNELGEAKLLAQITCMYAIIKDEEKCSLGWAWRYCL
jgi:hypothetical protein